NPHVKGSAEAGSTVKLYTGAGCTNQAGTGTADGSGHFDIAVTVDDDSTTTFTATATDAANNTSDCSTDSVTYIEDSTQPSVTVDQAAGQHDPTNSSPIQFTAVFSEPVNGFDDSDVSLSGSAGATTVHVTNPSSDRKTFDIAVSGMANDGAVTAAI